MTTATFSGTRDLGLARRRTMTDRVLKVLCTLATMIGVAFLAWIPATLFWKGFAGLNV
ncbi:hypothetical protein [Elioraea thermophila]|uniref:hypothetical protein n=1 Tax=Elioraea thermophila TaxID=2185104 RepID=UPI001E29D1F4|nr:hypothetical protein [Elioraea thermophila]